MSRLIDADALKEFINEGRVCDICPNKKPLCACNCDFPDYLTPLWEKVIDSIPTIDDLSEYSDKLWQKAYERGKAEERPQGEWIKVDEVKSQCSECGFKYADYRILFDYCPNCGADMRGGRECQK